MSSRVAARRRSARLRRHRRVRRRVSGIASRPRLAVFRSLKNMYVQVIDDRSGQTLVAASSLDPGLADELKGKSRRDQAAVVGRVVAERAKSAGVEAVVFDRGGFAYHGRVAALAGAAREAGLKF